MKKQINPTIKAHLIRGAFYLLLLLAVCAIPFALAQRNAFKRPVTVKLPGTVPHFSSAMHGRKPFGPRTRRLLRSLMPNSVYMLDDGSAEDAIGFGNGFTNSEALWMNHFDVISGQTMISTISVAWGTPVNPDPSLNGMPVTIAVWSDPNGDGDPTDGLLLGSVAGTVQNAGTDTFVDYTFNPPIDVSAFTSFFIGDLTPSSTDIERFFQGIDETPPSHMQSWIAGNSDGSPVDINTIGNNDTIGTIDSFGLPGNWLIRGDTGAQVSPTPTPTGTPSSCSWSAGSDLPQVGARFVGVFFPANGKFYAMGGRDANDLEFPNPFEFDPGSNSWATKSATYPDGFTNNMACSVLNDSGTDYIYCVGGSNFAAGTTSGRVFRYDPIADAISSVPANWPSGDANILPGGFSVYNNNMYILGGFNVNVSMDDNIWQFDPVALTWTHKNAHLPTPLGYIPQATIGNLIYTGGGSTYDGTLLHDSTISLVYDPVADTIGNIAAIPRATGETRGLNFCNTMYVMGGGREAPNPSNEVDIYDPVADSWSVGLPFSEVRRNFATDTDGTNNIWIAGGYGADGLTKLASTEIFNCPVSPCGSASPTPTPTATATATATASATPTTTPTPGGRTTPTPRPRPTPPPRP